MAQKSLNVGDKAQCVDDECFYWGCIVTVIKSAISPSCSVVRLDGSCVEFVCSDDLLVKVGS